MHQQRRGQGYTQLPDGTWQRKRAERLDAGCVPPVVPADVEEQPPERTGELVIREHEGFFTPKLMRRYFEKAIKDTDVLAEFHPLNQVVRGDEFVEYVHPRTQAAWIGFALGMRTVQRMAKASDTPGVPVTGKDQQ